MTILTDYFKVSTLEELFKVKEIKFLVLLFGTFICPPPPQKKTRSGWGFLFSCLHS
jgi:hypothetical protein